MHFTLYTHFLQMLQELGPEAAAKKIKGLGCDSVELLETTGS